MTFQQFHTCIAPRILLMPIFLANKLQGKIKQVIKHKSHDCVGLKRSKCTKKKTFHCTELTTKCQLSKNLCTMNSIP